MKIFKIEFEPMWAVPHGLIIAALDETQARDIANVTVTHTDVKEISEVNIDKPCVVFYESGNY